MVVRLEKRVLSNIEEKVEFERMKAIREGQTAQEVQATIGRIRSGLFRAEELRVRTERRTGKDRPSARQREARRARDVRRAQRVQVPISEVERAGARGARGITRTPSRITGTITAAGARGGFGEVSTRAEFGRPSPAARRRDVVTRFATQRFSALQVRDAAAPVVPLPFQRRPVGVPRRMWFLIA